jgi:DNA helicase II / ATP-dependent DNA helicase PcrA
VPTSGLTSLPYSERVDETALLGDLDAEQRMAVTTPSTLVAVIAAAGSGKTRVLARRIAYRVAAGSAEARHTLALTFTRQAAGELRRRLRASGLREWIEAGTFHSVALGVMRQRWADRMRPAPNILNDRHRLIAGVAGRCPVETVAAERTWCTARGIEPDGYVAAARASNRRCGVPAATVAEVLADYELVKRRRGVIDLDDLLLILARELDQDREFADVVRWRFRHVLVDEAQDLNPVQYHLLNALVAGRHDLFMVGDPAQAIYGFNGADPSLLLDVERDLPGVEVVRLTTNRRCTPQIVDAGRHVLTASNQPGDAVSARADGPAVEVRRAGDEHAEAELVAGFVAARPPELLASGQVAVLARTHEQLALLRPALARAGVAVQHQALAPGSALAAAVNAATALRSATQLRTWSHDVLDTVPPAIGASMSAQQQAERRVAAAALEFLREQPYGDGSGFRSWIATTGAFAEDGNGGSVELLTFHAAKGREWHTVVVTGVETGLVPHRSATTIEAKAEEARLLHVAMTRAGERLLVTHAERRRGYARKPSPFIVGMPTGEVSVVAPPPHLGRAPDHVDVADVVALRTDSLRSWRLGAARAAALLPAQICSDADLSAIAAAPPSSPAELSALASFGPVTAAKVFAPIRAALDAADREPSI